MKSAVTLAAAVVALSFTIAHADTGIPNDLHKSVCSSDQTKYSGAIFNAGQGKTEMTKLLASTNFCTNETVSLSGLLGNVLQDRVDCICHTQAQAAQVGCATGQEQPTVTTVLDTSLSGCRTRSVVVSKCVRDPAAAYQAACKQGADMSVVDAEGNPAHPAQTSARVATPLPPAGGNVLISPLGAPSPESPYVGGSNAPGLMTNPYQWSAQSSGSQYALLNGYNMTYSTGFLGGNYSAAIFPSAQTSAVTPYVAPAPTSVSVPSASAPLPQQTQGVATSPGLGTYVVASTATLTPAGYTATSPRPVASILVQPSSAPAGSPFLVAWVSVGMSAQNPCIVQQGSTTLATGNEGAVIFSTKGHATGTLAFTLICASASGNAVSNSANVTLR